MVLTRRYLITDMGGKTLTKLAIAAVGVQEILLRTTMCARDSKLRALFGRKALTGWRLDKKREVWACAVATSMLLSLNALNPGILRWNRTWARR